MAPLPRIRGTQVGLRNPASVNAIKADMVAGRFRFTDPGDRMSAVRDLNATYHVEDGHHRMVAALELWHTTGDDRYVRQSLAHDSCEDLPAPRRSRPMPARDWWGRL